MPHIARKEGQSDGYLLWICTKFRDFNTIEAIVIALDCSPKLGGKAL